MPIIKIVSSSPHIKVKIVKSLQDLNVYLTKNKNEAKNNDAIWFYTKSFPDCKVKLVDHFPDLKIKYVNSKSQAGWQNKTHKLMGRINKK